jgi:hypothetical protein
MTESTIKEIYNLEHKLRIDRNRAVYTQDELRLLETAYLEIQEDIGRKVSKVSQIFSRGCSGCFDKYRTIVLNWLNANPLADDLAQYEIVPEVMEVVEEYVPTEPDYNSMTLAELRGLFPNIKSNSKAKFIELING